MADPGELDRPAGRVLHDTVGYCTAIWVDQEDERDAVSFILQVYTGRGESGGSPESTEREFMLALDSSTTVVLAQFQLLRDALRSHWDGFYQRLGNPLLVRVHFNFTSATKRYGIAYWVGVLYGEMQPTTVDDFFRESPSTDWYIEGEDG